ncbi:uncharacterized protein si:ch211-165g14.1 isoform X2 [Engraulis encrasicolus]|uniref:uncharacterized protein si:ch211-165g14.1 isoform X2 n=1 Tax=Engraulis encrasicolus TaxID=184585 RepID=UPI002FD6E0C8
MEPLDHSKAMHLQDPYNLGLDLNSNFKKSHIRSKSKKALAKTPAWRDVGSLDQSPMSFSGVSAEQRISQCHPEIPVQNVYSEEPTRRSPYCASPHFISHQSRFNGHPPASSPHYSCSQGVVKKRDGSDYSPVNTAHRIDLRNGHRGYSPMQQFDRKTVVSSTDSKKCQATAFNVTKFASHQGYKASVESSVGGAIASLCSQAAARSSGKVITEIRPVSSPEAVGSDSSDVIEVPLTNCVKNTTQSPHHHNNSQQVSVCDVYRNRGQTHHTHPPNARSTGSSGESEEEAICIPTSDYSTSSAVASHYVKAVSRSHASLLGEASGDMRRATEAYRQLRPKQEPTQQLITSPSFGGSRPEGSPPGKVASDAIPPAKRRRKKPRRQRPGASSGPPCLFPPQEPEIKLKFASQGQKEERRDRDSFCPYVRMEDPRQEFPLCTVVNCQEEDEAVQQRGKKKKKKGQDTTSSSSCQLAQASGAMPSTSCLRLGRLSAESRGRPTQTCSLCGWPGNSMGMGDLHGPYVPAEHTATTSKYTTGGPLEQNLRGHPWELAANVNRTAAAPAGSSSFHSSPGNPGKRACIDWTLESANKDPSERWIHEDCSIWSAGIFLVKGRLYGLEEAIRIAEETECSCCYKVGATLGCVFKGCCNKYHYTCALQTDCLLSEENFSMRCPKHKNKSSRLVTR